MSEEQARSFIEQATQSLQTGQLNQALDFANQAIMLDPTNGDAFSLKAVALAQLNQNAEATRAFEEAIQLQPENSKVRYNLAVHLVRQNQKIEGLGQAREALQLDPAHAGARELIAQLERELGVTAEPRPEGHAAPPIQGIDPNAPYAQNPYGQSPYGNQQPTPYGGERQGYSGSAHNIAFVEQMGPTWTAIGWALVAVYIILLIVQIPQTIETVRIVMENPQAQPPQNPVFTIIGLVGWVFSFSWMIIDIMDRRASWLWLVLYCICCCCGPVQAIYMLAGRKPK